MRVVLGLYIGAALFLSAMTLAVPAAYYGPPQQSPDLSEYAQKSELQAAIDAMNAAMAAPAQKLSAIPAAGPGTGKCRISVVPSELITSGGVQGTAGTCTRIVQCGTSAAYTVVQFNLGGGC